MCAQKQLNQRFICHLIAINKPQISYQHSTRLLKEQVIINTDTLNNILRNQLFNKNNDSSIEEDTDNEQENKNKNKKYLQQSLPQEEGKNNNYDIDNGFLEKHYDAIQLILKNKYKSIIETKEENNQFENESYSRIEKISFLNDQKKYIMRYQIYKITQQSLANKDYQKYQQEVKALEEQYIPQLLGLFKHILNEKYIVITYMFEYYITIKRVSQLTFLNDPQGYVKYILQSLITKIQKTDQYKREKMKKWNIGITEGKKKVVFLPFEQNITSINELYNQNFCNKTQSIKIQNIWQHNDLRDKFGTKCYFVCSKAYQQNKQILFYSLNKKIFQISLIHEQKSNLIQSFSSAKKQKGVFKMSQTQYCKFLKSKYLSHLYKTIFKQYVMTKQYSKLVCSNSVYYTQLNSQYYGYFYIKTYQTIKNIFKSKGQENVTIQSGEATQTKTKVINKSIQNIIDDLEADILSQINDLHFKNVIHGDISQGNIVYDFDSDKFILLDFQMAESLNQQRVDNTYLKGAFGTPKYMSQNMKNIYYKKQQNINLYDNDFTCLNNVINDIKKKYN